MDFSYLGFIYKENDKKREEKVLKNIYSFLLLTLNFRIEVLIFEVFILKIHVTNIKTSLCFKNKPQAKRLYHHYVGDQLSYFVEDYLAFKTESPISWETFLVQGKLKV